MASSKKKVSKKKVSKKVVRKTVKPGRKKDAFKGGDTVTAIKGMEKRFYKGFPRGEAYALLDKKGSMPLSAFVKAIEGLNGVKTRGQALGILTKLVDKKCIKLSGKGTA